MSFELNFCILHLSFFILLPGEWLSIQSEHFLLSYKEVDARSAREILLDGEEVLPGIAAHLGLDLSNQGIPTFSTEKGTPIREALDQNRIHIFLASTQEDFDRLTQNGVPDWGIGCALPSKNSIVLKAPRLVGKNTDLRSLIAHEISHILLHTRRPKAGRAETGLLRIPRWFDEGLAMFESLEWKAGNSVTLAWAVLTNSVLPLSSLETGFPASEKRARLAYVQSFSAIAYLLQEYGEEGLQTLLDNLLTTEDFEGALEGALGLTFDQFQQDWLAHLKTRYNYLYILTDSGILWGTISLLFLIALIVKTIKIRKRRRKLVEEDEWTIP